MLFNDETPKYIQLEDYFIENITSGVWPVHSKLKDEVSLSIELNVNRGTLRRTIKELVRKGMLSQIKGKGTFVVSDVIAQPLATRLISFSEALEEKSLTYKTIVLENSVEVPDFKVAAMLELKKNEKIVKIRRVRLVDKAPVFYMENYLPFKLFGELVECDMETTTLFPLIENKCGHRIDWGRRHFKAVSAAEDVAFNLGVRTGDAVMYMEQLLYNKAGIPIEYSRDWINSDKFDIYANLKR